MSDWRSVQLKDAGTWLSGGTPFTNNPRYWGGEIPWISAASLKDFRISQSDRRVTKLGAISGTRLVPPETVLFVVRGMSLKTEFRVGVTERQVAFGQDCKAVIPAPGIDAKFLALALKARSREILAMVDEAGHGTGRLPTDLISKLVIGLPDLDEQQRISEFIDSIDELIRISDVLLQKRSLEFQAITDNFLAPLDVGGSMADVLESNPKNGLYKPSADYGDDGLPIIRIDSIQGGEIDATSPLRRIRVDAPEQRLFGVRRNDVLINRVNTLDLVGKSAIVRHLPEPTVFESNIMRCRIRRDTARAPYIALWLGTAKAMSHFRSCAKSAIGQASINQRDVRSCPVPLPRLSDQDAILIRVDQMRSAIDYEKGELAKLQLFKQGLMDDLLTGRVRVLALYLGVKFAVGGDVVRRVKTSWKWPSSSSGVPMVSPQAIVAEQVTSQVAASFGPLHKFALLSPARAAETLAAWACQPGQGREISIYRHREGVPLTCDTAAVTGDGGTRTVTRRRSGAPPGQPVQYDRGSLVRLAAAMLNGGVS